MMGNMSVLLQLQPQALSLPEQERAQLAALLLRSLPADLEDADEGVAEALRREEEGQRDPGVYLSEEEFGTRLNTWMRGEK